VSRRSKLVILFAVLVPVLALSGWLISAYAGTSRVVEDAADILHDWLSENPDADAGDADSVLAASVLDGSLDARLLEDSVPGDVFGNPLHVEVTSDSAGVAVYVMSPGVDGMPGTFDDVGRSRSSVRIPPRYDDSLVPDD
jgi:hypothetical protein